MPNGESYVFTSVGPSVIFRICHARHTKWLAGRFHASISSLGCRIYFYIFWNRVYMQHYRITVGWKLIIFPGCGYEEQLGRLFHDSLHSFMVCALRMLLVINNVHGKQELAPDVASSTPFHPTSTELPKIVVMTYIVKHIICRFTPYRFIADNII